MALSIITNTTSIGAQNAVNSVNSSLSKTIRQLSTGLRINSAADDASGLAVSEKLRAQISGLAKAATNAQDAISMLQTAEGAMGSMTDIIQRMRELAVQAGDPAYTTNDRAMLQLEIDQLKDEINRVSTSTEFNTKKLLNGDAAALWSSTTGDISAVVKGEPAEGNYKISYMVDPGKSAVYKTDIMDIRDGVMSYDIKSNDTSIVKFSHVTDMLRTGDDSIKINVEGKKEAAVPASAELIGSSASKVSSVSAGKSFAVTAAATDKTLEGNKTYTFVNTGTTSLTINIYTAGGTAAKTAQTIQAGGSWTYKATDATGVNISASGSTPIRTILTSEATVASANASFTVEIKATQDIGKESASGTAQVRIRNSATGEMSDWISARIDTSTAAGSASKLTIINIAELDGAAGISIDELFSNITFDLDKDLEKNDTILLGVTGGIAANTGSDYVSIQVDADAADDNIGGPSVHYLKSDVVNSNYDKTTRLYTAQMDKAGNVYYGNIDVTFATMGTGSITTASTSAEVKILGDGDVASKYTRLADIARFVDPDGVNVLDNTQELTVYNGKGDAKVIYVEGSDTVEDFENKLTQALIDLGMGAATDNPNAVNVNNNLVNYVENPETNSNEAVRGTFVIQGALLGDASRISFSGDQALIDALSLAQIQQEEDSAMHVTVTDAHTGAYIGEDTVTDDRLRGVIQGIDVVINPASAADVSYNETTRTMEFNARRQPTVGYLHVVNNSTKAAVGANEGQVIDISIGQLNTASLEIEDVTVVSFENAQKSITKLDQALERLSKARATVGAQMNRLEYAIGNLNTTRENLTASESRIRDLDIAKASSDLAAQQVLLQSATAMLAQANQLPSYAAQLLK